MKTKELQEQLVANMKNWQKVENASVTSTSLVLEETSNPVIRAIMEIIQNDSKMHYRIQEMIIDSLEKEAIQLSPDELGSVWDKIEKHIEIEKRTVELAKEAIASLQGKKLVVQEYLLNYLLEDEEKHNHLLESMSMIKKGMYPYG